MDRTLFLAGDVMTGRAIDQALPRPGDPSLHEPSSRDARSYLALAEMANGPIGPPLRPREVWGEALEVLDRTRPLARIVNLETSVTTSDDWCREKDVHYRMHPSNVGCLTAARIDVAVLANNHVMDWGSSGLVDTLAALEAVGIRTAGAGRDRRESIRPAIVVLGGGVAGPMGRAVVWGIGSATSGIPDSWRAGSHRVGVNLVDDLSEATAAQVCRRVRADRRAGDVAIVSIHWGGNWGHDVPGEFRAFAHALVEGGVDVVHGHSSHHVRPIEVHRDRLILYGCGDLIDDYEGIGGHESWRPDLAVLFFVAIDAAGRLTGLRMVPMRMCRFRLRRADEADARWLADTLSRTSGPFGCGVVTSVEADGTTGLRLRW